MSERLRVQDVMTKRIVTVRQDTPFKTIVRRMDRERVSALPVVDEAGRLVGIVSEADLLLKEEHQPSEDSILFEGPRRRRERAKAAGSVAAAVMTSKVVSIRPEATLEEAARLIHTRGIKRLPVVDADGRVIGIVSRRDLLRVFLRPDADISREVSEQIIRRMFWLDRDAIRVLVVDGMVTLEGQLEQKSLIESVVERVKQVDGVVSVNNRLSYQVDDEVFPVEMLGPWGIHAHSRS